MIRVPTSRLALLPVFCLLAFSANSAWSQTPLELVRAEQDRLVAMIDRVSPAVVAVYDVGLHGGGSGVIIDPEGYGITNHHVVAGFLNTRRGRGGLGDGNVYDLEVLGIDPIGDVAMFRLTGRDSFPYVGLGDSDRVRVGDVAIPMGNPFNISEDHSPTITRGIVTGVNRYQWGNKGLLIYSDCIQIDAPINPGNSGGPLFNVLGEVIGINGRISVNTRGRLNVGFGYAIASNQVKRFVPVLRAGLVAEHGTFQATVEESAAGVHFALIRPEKCADRAGIQSGDRLLAIDGLPVESANRFASIAGTYPAHWQVLVEVERAGERKLLTAELDAVAPKMGQPYVPNPWLAAREVFRTLRGHQAARLVGNRDQSPKRLRWTTQRVDEKTLEAERAVECFENVLAESGSMMIQPLTESGNPARRSIEVSAGKVVQRQIGSEEEFELTVDQQMLHAAMQLIHYALLAPLDTLDIWPIKPAGGNVLYRKDDSRQSVSQADTVATSASLIRQKYGLTAHAVEMLEWPFGESSTAQLAFAVDTHDLLRVVVRDIPTGARVSVDITDYQESLGVRRPARMTITGPNFLYTDTLTEWEEAP